LFGNVGIGFPLVLNPCINGELEWGFVLNPCTGGGVGFEVAVNMFDNGCDDIGFVVTLGIFGGNGGVAVPFEFWICVIGGVGLACVLKWFCCGNDGGVGGSVGLIFVLRAFDDGWSVGGNIGAVIWVGGVDKLGGNNGDLILFVVDWDIGGKI